MTLELYITLFGVIGTLAFQAYKSWLDHTEKVESHFKKLVQRGSPYVFLGLALTNAGVIAWVLMYAPWPLSRTGLTVVVVGGIGFCGAISLLFLQSLINVLRAAQAILTENVLLSFKVSEILLASASLSSEERAKLLKALDSGEIGKQALANFRKPAQPVVEEKS